MNYVSSPTLTATSNPTTISPSRYPVNFRTETNGNKIVEIGMAHNRTVIMDEVSYTKLIGLGLKMTFWVNDNGKGNEYVRTHYSPASKTENNVQVVRLILDGSHGTVVRYKDGNRLNLRLSNLYLDSKVQMLTDMGVLDPDFANQF